jgi:YYY domain-containing protein
VIDTLEAGKSLDYTITEFPFFTFLVGDLHPHLTSIPFLLLNLSLVLNLSLSRDMPGLGWLRRNPWEAFALALILGAQGFINLWDLPLLAGLLAVVLFMKGYSGGHAPPRAAFLALLTLLPLVAGALLLYISFYLTFDAQASGILPVRGVATRPLHFVLIWGFFLLLSLSFLLRQLWELLRHYRVDRAIVDITALVCLVPFLAWMALEVFLRVFEGELLGGLLAILDRFFRVLPGMVVAGIALYSALLRARLGQGEMAFPLLLVFVGFYILMGAELFYISDVFGTRMNTVFKLYFQAWIFLALASAYSLYYWHSRPLPVRILPRAGDYAWNAVVAVLLVASLYYSPGAAWDKADGFKSRPTLDGLAFLLKGKAGEYQAIRWLRDEAPWGRIVEAVGGSYTEYGRISASTGLPTVLGWVGHEIQWRSSGAPLKGRARDVEEIYRSQDVEKVKALLDKYGVRYVYVGPRERASYGPLGLEKFGRFMRPVFNSRGVVIYERRE